MVLSYEEQEKLEKLKQKNKVEIMNLGHECNMKELEKQLMIESVRAYSEKLDYKVKEQLTLFIGG